MSCVYCEAAQEKPRTTAYIRVGNANVEITGCEKHLGELIDIYRKGLKLTPPSTNNNEGSHDE
jgi:hypothetical protein